MALIGTDQNRGGTKDRLDSARVSWLESVPLLPERATSWVSALARAPKANPALPGIPLFPERVTTRSLRFDRLVRRGSVNIREIRGLRNCLGRRTKNANARLHANHFSSG